MKNYTMSLSYTQRIMFRYPADLLRGRNDVFLFRAKAATFVL